MDKQIVIIGAGAAGVAAAAKLGLNGFKNITILEAGDRIGGRIHTIPFGASVLDMGAQWFEIHLQICQIFHAHFYHFRCHGEMNNVVYEMAKDKDVLDADHEIPLRKDFIQSDGKEIPDEISIKLANVSFNIYLGEYYDEEKNNYNGSFGNFFTDK